MKRYQIFYTALSKELTQHRRHYLWITGIFILGIILGTAAAVASDDKSQIRDYFDLFLSAYPLQGAAQSEIFKLSLLNYLQLALMIWVSGWYLWLLPLGILQVAAKGFRTGFTISCLLQCYQFRGALLAFLSLLPQNLIFLPALCFFTVYQFQFLSDRRYLAANAGQTVFKKQVYRKNAVFFACFMLLLIVCALTEGYVIPTLLHPLCGFFAG